MVQSNLATVTRQSEDSKAQVSMLENTFDSQDPEVTAEVSPKAIPEESDSDKMESSTPVSYQSEEKQDEQEQVEESSLI